MCVRMATFCPKMFLTLSLLLSFLGLILTANCRSISIARDVPSIDFTDPFSEGYMRLVERKHVERDALWESWNNSSDVTITRHVERKQLERRAWSGHNLRILCVGDSITAGIVGSTDGNGYRLFLRNQIKRAGKLRNRSPQLLRARSD